jgi:WD40 repeat protein
MRAARSGTGAGAGASGRDAPLVFGAPQVHISRVVPRRSPCSHAAVSLSNFRLPRALGAAMAAAALLAGCGEGGGNPKLPVGGLTLSQSSGLLERGGTVTVSVTADGQPVAAGQVSLTVTPADAAEVVDGGTLRLLRAGELEVRAKAGERTGTVKLTVVPPPTVVFDMTVSGNRDLYRVSLDGGEFTRLTENLSDERDPSAGGGSVVYVTFRHGSGELYSIPLAGGAETRITTTTTRSESAPAFSPDGQRLAYATDPSGVAKLWTATANNGGAAQAAPNFGFDGSPETSPAWAPSGNRLAFVGTATGTADIYQLSLGGEPQMLVGGTAAEVDPAWSPDGQWVAFASTREGDPAIFVVRVSSGAVTRLSSRTGTEAEPSWTKDGRLVYTEFLPGDQTRLVWIDPDTPQTVNPIPVPAGFPRRPTVAQ